LVFWFFIIILCRLLNFITIASRPKLPTFP
jgi:hypothetical protein